MFVNASLVFKSKNDVFLKNERNSSDEAKCKKGCKSIE